MYDPTMVAPMREELTNLGVIEAKTPEDVNKLIQKNKTVIAIINSICGCAAANARPAIQIAKRNEKQPTCYFTAFAGNDAEAVNAIRETLVGYPPSSPNIILLKEGEVVLNLERHLIEGRTAEEIASDLTDSFNKFCD